MARRVSLPALLAFLVCPCFGQSNSETPASNPPSTSSMPADSSSTATKKVWTNEDFPGAKGGVSTKAKRKQNDPATPRQVVDEAAIEHYRKSIAQLQGQLEDVNKKLKSYKEFLEGEPVSTGSRDLNKGLNRVPVDQQILQLQEKKKKLEAQIGDLYDEARKKGIESGQLP